MCTAVTYQTRDFYFGRTLDHDISYGEEVTITPRWFPLRYREAGVQETHYAIIGMARVAENYPLYFDAVNEKGLAMAGLNFVGFAAYGQSMPGRNNIAHFELIPWVLSRCACVREARKLLERLNITGQPFSSDLPPAQLHWILADREEAITLEAMADGLHIHTNPVGVLTNNPPFDDQLRHLTDFMQLSPEPPVNRLFPAVDLEPYSRGLGAMGLPGDFSSQSRFVRAAFVRQTSVSGESEAESVSHFFAFSVRYLSPGAAAVREMDSWSAPFIPPAATRTRASTTIRPTATTKSPPSTSTGNRWTVNLSSGIP